LKNTTSDASVFPVAESTTIERTESVPKSIPITSFFSAINLSSFPNYGRIGAHSIPDFFEIAISTFAPDAPREPDIFTVAFGARLSIIKSITPRRRSP
jgi:hypothetical protein